MYQYQADIYGFVCEEQIHLLIEQDSIQFPIRGKTRKSKEFRALGING